MTRLIASLLFIFFLPGVALASVQSWVSAVSNTGGNVVGPGGSITTGDASAQATVRTTTNGSSSSSVYIKTDANGVVHEESRVSTSSNVIVSVQATPIKTSVEIREGTPPRVIKQETVSARAGAVEMTATNASSSVAAPAARTTEATALAPAQTRLQKLFSWFAALFKF